MGPVGHTLISGVVGGGIWVVTGSTAAVPLAVGVGVLMDGDHLYDFHQWYIKRRRDKVYLLLHAWEYSMAGLVVLALGFYHPLFLATVLVHLTHVATDHWHNGLSRFGYSIIYRMVKRFDVSFVSPHYDMTTQYQGFPRLLPFGRLLEPWFRRRIQPWFDKRMNDTPHTNAGIGLEYDD